MNDVLIASLPRPTDNDHQSALIKYAVKFADNLARRLAADLEPNFRGIQAMPTRTAGSVAGGKQLDVNFSTPQHGLELGVSLKSVHFRDKSNQRYTHNMKRNEEELRIEASGYHKRQPYAVMVGVLFLPFGSCEDAKTGSSSFGSWVRKLRPYSGRVDPTDDVDQFEKLYVALYEPDGSRLRFFDVESAPPKAGRPPATGELLGSDGRPRRSLSYTEFLDALHHAYLRRNRADFQWAGGEEAPLSVNEEENEVGDDVDTEDT